MTVVTKPLTLKEKKEEAKLANFREVGLYPEEDKRWTRITFPIIISFGVLSLMSMALMGHFYRRDYSRRYSNYNT